MKIAVIDDDQKDNSVLRGYLEQYLDSEHIKAEVESFQDVNLFFEQYFPEKYEIIFLDVYLDCINGMTVARKIREMHDKSILIFSTVSTEYAVESYRVRAFDYLLKPYTYEQFCKIIRLCMEELSCQSRYIVVKEGRSQVNILLDDIIYTDYSNHYIQIHVPNKTIKTYMKFADFSPMLLEFDQFICCYRNCIVNMDQVIALNDCGFELENKEIIPVRRGQIQKVKQIYTDYIFFKLGNKKGTHGHGE